MASSGRGDAETEDAQGVEEQVSAKQSPIPPPLQTKSKGHKSAFSSGRGDAETEDAQGVEEKVSAKQSPIHPPLQTKSKGRKRPGESANTRIRSNKAKKKKGGSKQVYTKTLQGTNSGPNNRTCLPKAVMRVLLPDINRDTRDSVWHAMTSAMPKEGDTSVKDISGALAMHGMQLDPVSGEYIKKGGAPIHLFKEHECKLILKIQLTNQKDEVCHHFVAWDGKTIHDDPQSSIVNKKSDRKDKESSDMVFHKHFKDFKKWQITNVYRLKSSRDLLQYTKSHITVTKLAMKLQPKPKLRKSPRVGKVSCTNAIKAVKRGGGQPKPKLRKSLRLSTSF
jgi:hypothetical protein